MVTLLLLIGAAVQQPSAEAIRLGNEIAAHGTLAALLPLKEQQDSAEIIAEAKDLTPAEKAQLKATVHELYAAGEKRLFAATGRSFAEQLSLSDLRTIAAFYRTGAAQRFQNALPTAIVSTMKSVGEVDIKKDARAAFCKQTGKLCSK